MINRPNDSNAFQRQAPMFWDVHFQGDCKRSKTTNSCQSALYMAEFILSPGPGVQGSQAGRFRIVGNLPETYHLNPFKRMAKDKP